LHATDHSTGYSILCTINLRRGNIWQNLIIHLKNEKESSLKRKNRKRSVKKKMTQGHEERQTEDPPEVKDEKNI